MAKKQIKIACMDGVGYGEIEWFKSVLEEGGKGDFEFVIDEKIHNLSFTAFLTRATFIITTFAYFTRAKIAVQTLISAIMPSLMIIWILKIDICAIRFICAT